MSVPNFEAVYTWPGPPRIEFQRQVGRDSRHSLHRLVVQGGEPGAVIVAHRDGSVVLVRSRRIAAGEELWEFPRGFGEPDDRIPEDLLGDPCVNAGVRELVEETGLHPVSARSVGTYIVDPSIYPARVGVVWVEVGDDEQVGEADGEIEELRWVRIDHLPDLVVNGTLRDAHTLSAVALLLSDRGRRVPTVRAH